ncbi:MAG: hypothetical protein ACQ9MH_05915 [Nitrospinales bacterium]
MFQSISSRTFPKYAFFTIFFTALTCYLFLAAAGYFQPGRGDPAQRVIISFEFYKDLLGLVFSERTMYEMWPPGYFVLQGLVIKLGEALGQSVNSILNEIMLLSIFMWAIGIWFFRKTVSLFDGEEAGSWAGLFMMGSPILLHLAGTTYAEIYCFGLLGISFWFMALSTMKPDFSSLYVLLGAVFLFVANTFRHEMAVIAAGIGLYFILRKEYLKAGIVLVVGCSFLGARVVYSYFFMSDAVTFLNYTKFHTEGLVEISYKLKQMISIPDVIFLGVFFMSAGLLKWICIKNFQSNLPIINIKHLLKINWRISGLFLIPAIIHMVFLVYAVFTVNSDGGHRFLLFPILFAGIISGASIGKNFQNKIKIKNILSLRTLNAIQIIISLVVVFYFINYSTKDHTYPPPLRESMEWLNKNNPSLKAINFDYLFWNEQPLKLNTGIDLNSEDKSFIFTHSPKLKSPLPEDFKNPLSRDKGKFITTAKSHLHIYDYRPKFLVLASDSFYEEFKEYAPWSHFGRNSFIREYLTQTSLGEFKFISPYLPITLNINLNRVFSNSLVSIFEITYVDQIMDDTNKFAG